MRYVRPWWSTIDQASSGFAKRETEPLVPRDGSCGPGGRAGGSGSATRSVKRSVTEFASGATRTRYCVPALASASISASPLLLVRRHSTVLSCERRRTNSSTTASMSPAASRATSRLRSAPTVNEYQTEFLIGAHGAGGSSGSSVAPTVVPDTVAGSESACGAERASLGGGAANAGAASATRTTSAASEGPARRTRLDMLGSTARTHGSCGLHPQRLRRVGAPAWSGTLVRWFASSSRSPPRRP